MASNGEPARNRDRALEIRRRINLYFASLNDHEATTTVTCYGAPADAQREEWPIRQVEAYFADRANIPGKSPIFCTALPLRNVSPIVLEFRTHEDKSVLQRLIAQHPNFIGRTMIAESGICYTIEALEFDAWVAGVATETAMLTIVPPGGKAQMVALKDNRIIACSKGDKLMFAFFEDAMVNMGYISPGDEEEGGVPTHDQ